MRQERVMMGMPMVVDIDDPAAREAVFDEVFAYFNHVDEKFSTYRPTSEVSQINAGAIPEVDYSAEMKTVLALSEETKQLTGGYFDITKDDGTYDPSGLVKGWAIHNAADLIRQRGFKNFYVEAGGDVQVCGRHGGQPWTVGIRNPFPGKSEEVVKVLRVSERGVATSGTYLRGQHIYNPKARDAPISDIVSLTVIGPNVYEADRFATAAFAMGRSGIAFIETLPGFEGYLIDTSGVATMTSGLGTYMQ